MATYQGWNGQIILDGDHLTIVRNERWTKLGIESQVIPLASLSGLTTTEPGRVKGGFFQLEIEGEPPREPSVKDPNTLVFAKGERQAFAELAEIIRQQIAANQSAADTHVATPERARATFAGITLFDTTVRSADGGGPLAGAVATVDTAGQLTRRISLTRVALTGPLAWAWRKKIDERELYLVIEGDGWAISASVDPKRGAEARDFAAKINAAAAAARPTASVGPPTVATDPMEQLRKLSELRESGVVTAEEFEEKKRELLDRI